MNWNERALKKAKNMYPRCMDYWSASDDTKIIATSEQINQKHEQLQKTITNGLKNQLKGQKDEFTKPYLTQLQQVLLKYFIIKTT